MNILRVSLPLASVALAALPASAQNTVQLPTLSSFQTRTTVSVPDRGSVFTGGINRGYEGRNEFGTHLLPFRNRSIGSQWSASNVWTSVYIHDFEAMDEALLRQARGSGHASSRRPSRDASSVVASGTGSLPRQPQTQAPSWQPQTHPMPTAGPLSKSVAQLQAEREAEQQARQAEAEQFFQRGKQAEANGKPNVAKIFYQQAFRRAQGPLQEQILAQLRLVTQSSVAQR